MNDDFRRRGFLPAADPLTAFPRDSPYAMLDGLGDSLPGRLRDPGFRAWAGSLTIPAFAEPVTPENLPALRLYYVRIGFLASAYVNQIGQPQAHRLPANIAVPLCRAADLLGRPAILSYAGYALYNWYRLDPGGPVALGNIDTFQNFVDLYDEHWFILVHVDIEARAAQVLDAILGLAGADGFADPARVNAAVERITASVVEQVGVLRRIPEHMSPDLYFKDFRPYIRFFEDVVYEGVDRGTMSFRGETGAQSSVMPVLIAFFKIPHEASVLTRQLDDMRNYMPPSHRALIERIGDFPDVRGVADRAVFNAAMEAIAEFRGVHYGWAQTYIAEHVTEPLGTGGTDYIVWLDQLRRETLAHRLP